MSEVLHGNLTGRRQDMCAAAVADDDFDLIRAVQSMGKFSEVAGELKLGENVP